MKTKFKTLITTLDNPTAETLFDSIDNFFETNFPNHKFNYKKEKTFNEIKYIAEDYLTEMLLVQVIPQEYIEHVNGVNYTHY